MFRLLIETRDVPAELLRDYVLSRLLDVVFAVQAGATVGDIRVGDSPPARVGSYMLEQEDNL